jgi:hypothetical protein
MALAGVKLPVATVRFVNDIVFDVMAPVELVSPRVVAVPLMAPATTLRVNVCPCVGLAPVATTARRFLDEFTTTVKLDGMNLTTPAAVCAEPTNTSVTSYAPGVEPISSYKVTVVISVGRTAVPPAVNLMLSRVTLSTSAVNLIWITARFVPLFVNRREAGWSGPASTVNTAPEPSENTRVFDAAVPVEAMLVSVGTDPETPAPLPFTSVATAIWRLNVCP